MRDRLELLRVARIIANFEYQELREDLHNNWLLDSNAKWIENKSFVPYPSMPPFPAESEVVSLAQDLKTFLDQRKVVPSAPVAPTAVAPVEETKSPRPAIPAFPMEPNTTDPDKAEEVMETKKETTADDKPAEEVKAQPV